jgi:hypothetical protein
LAGGVKEISGVLMAEIGVTGCVINSQEHQEWHTPIICLGDNINFFTTQGNFFDRPSFYTSTTLHLALSLTQPDYS